MKLLISCVLRAGASDSATQPSTGLRSTAALPPAPRPARDLPAAALPAASLAVAAASPVFEGANGEPPPAAGEGGQGGQTRRCPAGPALKRPLTVAPPVPYSCVRIISH